MKISKQVFFAELKKQLFNKDNCAANIEHNAGQHNRHNIYKCIIDGMTFYYGGNARSANTDKSIIKRLCY